MMKYEKGERQSVPFYRGSNSKLKQLLEGFEKSGLPMAKVITPKYKSAVSGKSSINNALQRWGMTHIACKIKDNSIYLVRRNSDEII